MFGKNYFEKLLSEQVSSMGQSVTVKVYWTGRSDAADVRGVFAAHDGHVILEVFPNRERLGWQKGMPPEEHWVYDQLTLPYEMIMYTEVTVREPERDETTPIGFRG